MDYLIKKPSRPLSPYVKQYWMFEASFSMDTPYIHRIVPNGLFELTFYFGDNKPVRVGSSKNASFSSQLTGLLGGYFDISLTGKLSLFSIYFKPHGISSLFGFPGNELANSTAPLNEFFAYDAERLEDELLLAVSFEKRVAIVERFLLQKVHNRKEDHVKTRVAYCMELIHAKKGLITIDELVSASCFSRKQFERVFTESTGLSPKQFLKTVRFQNAVHKKSINEHVSLTQLAHRSGYYDQSHMIADFSNLTGYTPKKYFNAQSPFSDYFY